MRATPNFNFTTVLPTKEALTEFVTMLRSLYQHLTDVINGHIGFGDGTNADNVDGAWVNVVTPAAPNTDFTVNHNLGRLPVGYWIMQKDRAVDVYTGSVAATKTQLTLRATVASAVIRLFIISILLGFFAAQSEAQNVAYHDIALTTANTAVGLVVRPVSSALITVCAGAHAEIPCTPPTTIFSTTAGASQTNPFNADINGNFTFYAVPGLNYTVSISGVGVVGYSFPFYAPLISVGSVGAVTATSVTSSNGTSALTGFLRIGSSEQLCWRNNANTADLCLNKSAGDVLLFGTSQFALANTSNTFANSNSFTSTNNFTGGLLANTTQTNAKYAAEFASAASPFYGQFRIGQQNVNTGMVLGSSQANNATMSIGSVPDNTCGSGWRATDIGATDFHMGGGGLQLLEWHADSSLTAGNCFSPSLRMVLSGNQFQLNNGTSVIPSYTWLSESPNPGTGFFRTSSPGLGLSVSNGTFTSPSGVGQWIFLVGEQQPFTDNAINIGDTTHRVATIWASTMSCGTAGNITCIQSDGSNNLFIGNSNVGSGGITLTPGGGSLNLNKGLHPSNGTGYQAKAGTAGCATAASVGATCTTVVTWTNAFIDTSYTPHCDGLLITSGIPVEGGITAIAAGSVTFQTVAATAAVAQFTNIVCSAFHN
jgi:hypothetical protein